LHVQLVNGDGMTADLTLSELEIGDCASVFGVASDGVSDPIAARLCELGFDEGVQVELLHRGPMGGNPLAVKVGGAVIALRKAEAARVGLRLAR
jgi:ferrous iron transport protein A